MALLGRASDRLGRRRFLAISGAVFGAGIAGLSVANGYPALLAVFSVLYASSGLFDVGINAAAVDLERTAGRRLMTLFHAAFSAGGFVGALSAGALLEASWDYRAVYLCLLLPLGAVLLAVAATRFPEVGGPREAGERVAAGRGLFRNGALLLVAAIATLGLLSEGEMEHWSGVYLRNTLGLSALLGGSGVAVFYGSMAVGRLGAAFVIGRLGNRRTLRGAGLLAAGGMILALATREPALVVAGFLVVGLALSAVVPITFSVAGDIAPERAGGAISVVTTLGYGGFLLGPVIVGGLAEVFGLRAALGIVAVAGLMIFAFSSRLKVT
jgi:MFS family permease